MLGVSCTYHHRTMTIASMWMRATMESVLSWNNKTPRGVEALRFFQLQA